MKKRILFSLILAVLVVLNTTGFNASARTYNYSPLGEVIESARSMTVKRTIDNSNLMNEDGTKATITLGNLVDVYSYEEQIYVVDSSNHRVLVFNDNYRLVDVFPHIKTDDNGTVLNPEVQLNGPKGIYIRDGLIYIADELNERIAIFDVETKELVREVKDPQDPTFTTPKSDGTFTRFRPLKVAVDRTGRMFVIAHDIFEGVMDFNPDGSFSRFFGTNVMTMSLWEALVYKLSTEEQRARQKLRLQSSFTSIDIDQYGYVYLVSRPDVEDVIKKINFKGQDVLRKGGYIPPIGDVVYEEIDETVTTGPSSLVDVAVSADGIFYSVLDENRGRIFTYDSEGNLLYIFGQIGNQSTMFRKPASLTYFNDDIIVTDTSNNSIIVFEPTEFGQLINEATRLYFSNKYSEAKEYWEKVLKLNSNYFLAYAGIGKAQLREENFEEAMENLKLGYDYYNYSRAYEQYRNTQLNKVLPYALVLGFIGLGYMFVKSMYNSVKRESEEN